jgi:3-hydroxymyristoyl/3-hydroxydecanoyl-(acyl carrier protein) dehydratase
MQHQAAACMTLLCMRATNCRWLFVVIGVQLTRFMLAVAPQTTYDVPAADNDQQQLAEKVQAFIRAK